MIASQASTRRVVQFSNWTTDLIAYAPPSIKRFEGPGAFDSLTTGGQQIDIIGTDFATSKSQQLESVYYGPAGDEY